MATLKEYQDNAALMGEVIADAAKKRGEIAVKSQEAERRAKRREAADKWADDPSVSIEALDFGGDPSTDGPIVGDEFQKELEKLLRETRSKARYFIGPQVTAADKIASAAPQDLSNLVLSMQMRNGADYEEVADLYTRCAPVSWPLAKSVSDAARKFGLFIWDEQGTLDAEATRALMRKTDELLSIIAGKASERPTTPAYGAQSTKHGKGLYAVLELLETLDGAILDYDGVCDALIADTALLAVYDMATGRVTVARATPDSGLDTRALKRMAKAHKDATEGNKRDYTAIDERERRAFGL